MELATGVAGRSWHGLRDEGTESRNAGSMTSNHGDAETSERNVLVFVSLTLTLTLIG